MALEGAEDCLLSSSGMCSATTMLLALVPQGGHIVTTTDCYRRTRQFIQTVLPKMNISCTVIDPSDIKGLQRWAAASDGQQRSRATVHSDDVGCRAMLHVAGCCHCLAFMSVVQLGLGGSG
eukprot:GHRQ01031282.1.p4 GENE.GHRQ01031282.1~~GHRQ01031282.1.p4  ORF type:complete len:121 (-),score=28.84 GHRQ01031282.1:119-481(-)